MAPQLTAKVERSFIRDGNQVTEFRVPAISESRAESNALLNARAKGMDSPNVIDIEEVGESSIPGRSIFLVTVEAIR